MRHLNKIIRIIIIKKRRKDKRKNNKEHLIFIWSLKNCSFWEREVCREWEEEGKCQNEQVSILIIFNKNVLSIKKSFKKGKGKNIPKVRQVRPK